MAELPLSPRRRLFVAEYLSDPARNGKQAAIRAGYLEAGAAVVACRLLKSPKVKAAIKRAMSARMKQLRVTEADVTEQLARLAFSDIRRLVGWTDGKVSLRDSDTIDDDTAAAITEIRMTENGLVVKLADKRGSLELLGKNLGIFVDRTEHTGPGGTELPPAVINLTLTTPTKDEPK